MKSNWQSLRVGDRIRFLRMPEAFSQPNFHLPADTRDLYELLIVSGDALEIVEIQEYDRGTPLASYDDLRDPTNPILHALTIDDLDEGCWKLIQ